MSFNETAFTLLRNEKYINVPTIHNMPIITKITGYIKGSVPNAFSKPGKALCFAATFIAKTTTHNIKTIERIISQEVVAAFLEGNPVTGSNTLFNSDSLKFKPTTPAITEKNGTTKADIRIN